MCSCFVCLVHCTIVQCVAVCCSFVSVCCSLLHVLQCVLCVAVYCSVLQCSAVCCSVLWCEFSGSVIVRCSVLQFVAGCCCVLQCVNVCCIVPTCVAGCQRVYRSCVEYVSHIPFISPSFFRAHTRTSSPSLPLALAVSRPRSLSSVVFSCLCATVCCRALPCVAVCCSV